MPVRLDWTGDKTLLPYVRDYTGFFRYSEIRVDEMIEKNENPSRAYKNGFEVSEVYCGDHVLEALTHALGFSPTRVNLRVLYCNMHIQSFFRLFLNKW